MNKLLDSKQERILPASNSDKELADSFMTYFQEKISKIRDNFKFNEEVVIPDLPESAKWNNNLSVLEETTADEILQIVSTYGIKTYTCYITEETCRSVHSNVG